MTFDPSNFEGTNRIAHIEKYVGAHDTAIAAIQNGGSIAAVGDVTINSDSDVSGAGDIIFKAGSTEYGRISATGTITGLAAAANVPTISELCATGGYGLSTVSAANSVPVFVAEFGLNIAAGSFVTWNSDHTTSDTDYWTITIRRYRANVSADIAVKTTKVTGGSAITRRTDWNFDAITFDASNKVFLKGDICACVMVPTGAPTALSGFAMTVRYEPT